MRGSVPAARRTALYPAMVAMDDSTSMLCARVIRGISSSANAVTPREAMSRTVSGAPSGSAMPMTTCPCRIDANISGTHLQRRRLRQTHQHGWRHLRALFLIRAVGKSGALAGAPFDNDVEPRFFQRSDRRGHERDAVLARKLFGGNADPHGEILLHTCLAERWFGGWWNQESGTTNYTNRSSVQLTIALAQLNPTVGDIDGNLARIRRARDRAAAGGADLVVLPELALIGYPPEDLVLRPSVVDACHAAIDCLVRESHNAPALIATTPWRENGRVYNAAIVIDKGATTRRFKSDLPNYGVFDEKRVFAPGPMPEPVNFRGIKIGVPVCEDIWTPAVAAHLARAGAEFFLVPNGSPFETGKFPTRIELARARTRETNRALVYVNQIGGQDELVFDGRSFVLNRSGEPRVLDGRLGRSDRADAMDARRRRVDVRARPRRGSGRAARRYLQRLDDRLARLRRQERLSRNRARAVRRRRLGPERGRRCRCARARASAGRPAAVAVYRRGEHGGSAVHRRPARHSTPDAADRRGDDERGGARWRRSSKAGRATSRKRIFRPASAACC